MSDDLSAILETTTAERLATGVQQQLGHASISQTAESARSPGSTRRSRPRPVSYAGPRDSGVREP